MVLLEVDGCTNYTVLSEADRAQGNAEPPHGRDDSTLKPGWYRFQGAAGDRMPDKCVPLNHCGVKFPGWLNDTHPTVAEGVVTRKVCYDNWDYYWYGSNDCCYLSSNIRVRNCGAFFVYELQKPPRCDLRYCGNASSAGKLPCLIFLSLSVNNQSSSDHHHRSSNKL